MSNTNKELYEWAWDEYYKGREIDILLGEFRRFQSSWELARGGQLAPLGISSTMSINKTYIPLLIEALENLK